MDNSTRFRGVSNTRESPVHLGTGKMRLVYLRASGVFSLVCTELGNKVKIDVIDPIC